jgi:membrane associated rhomboid family serine protease
MDGPGTAVRVTPSRRIADEWAVVLAAAGIPHWQRQRLDGWALFVTPDDVVTALEALAAYDRENADDDDGGADEAPPARPLTIAGVVVALLLVGFFAITGPRAGGSSWFEHGSADAARIMAGEWWRTVTALTLHADAPHLAGNAVGLAVLLTAVCWQLGVGVGLWLTLLAGAGGNLLTAAVHGSEFSSVGASTAVFGVVGILAGLRVVAPRRLRLGTRKSWVVVAASLALLALLGTGPHADLLAHLFGLLGGGALGVLAALTLPSAPPPALQGVLLIAAIAVVLSAWQLAF